MKSGARFANTKHLIFHQPSRAAFSRPFTSWRETMMMACQLTLIYYFFAARSAYARLKTYFDR